LNSSESGKLYGKERKRLLSTVKSNTSFINVFSFGMNNSLKYSRDKPITFSKGTAAKWAAFYLCTMILPWLRFRVNK